MGAKSVKKEEKEWVPFIPGIKSGISTLTRLFAHTFLTVLWTIWCETPRYMDLRGLAVLFNSSGSSLPSLTDLFPSPTFRNC
uniref:Uncharacterized protein n=1 Tax=Lepeophtheirus salmonis TaxID=72036 RepID=A0A0K2U4U6_LEPSM